MITFAFAIYYRIESVNAIEVKLEILKRDINIIAST